MYCYRATERWLDMFFSANIFIISSMDMAPWPQLLLLKFKSGSNLPEGRAPLRQSWNDATTHPSLPYSLQKCQIALPNNIPQLGHITTLPQHTLLFHTIFHSYIVTLPNTVCSSSHIARLPHNTPHCSSVYSMKSLPFQPAASHIHKFSAAAELAANDAPSPPLERHDKITRT